MINRIYLNFVETPTPGSKEYGVMSHVSVEGVAMLTPGAQPRYRKDWQTAIAEVQESYGQQLDQAEVVVWNSLHTGEILNSCGIKPPTLTDVRWLGRCLLGNRPYETLSEVYTRCGGMPLPPATATGKESFAIAAVTALRHSAEYLLPLIPVQELAVIRQTAAIAHSPTIQVDAEALKPLLSMGLKEKYPHLYSFGERVLSSTDSSGRLHVLLDYNRAGTGRFSAAKGCPIHGIPRLPAITDPAYAIVTAILSTIKAPPGYLLVMADAKAIEPRLFAYMSGEEKLFADLTNSVDIYSRLVEVVFGNSGIAADTLRQIGKRTFIAYTYGVGADTLFKGLAAEPELKGMVDDGIITIDSCARLLAKLKADYPQLISYGRALEDAVRKAYAVGTVMFGFLKVTYAGDTMTITLPSGRPLNYYGFAIGPDKGITYLSAGNETKKLYGSKLAQNIIQATARDILVEVIYRLETAGYPIMFHVHDAVVCLAEEAEASNCLSAMVAAWQTGPAWINGLVLDAEGNVGRSFAEL